MKYYYGNSIKEAISNKPVEIKNTIILEQYKEVYSVVIPATEKKVLNQRRIKYGKTNCC